MKEQISDTFNRNRANSNIANAYTAKVQKQPYENRVRNMDRTDMSTMSKWLLKRAEKKVAKFSEQEKKYMARAEKHINKLVEGHSRMTMKQLNLVTAYDPNTGYAITTNVWAPQLVKNKGVTKRMRNNDAKLYKKEGIKITRDDQGRIASVKSENTDAKTVKRINKITRKGYY